MNPNDPFEHDESSPEEDPKDEFQEDSKNSEWLDNGSMEPTEAIDPPDWLFQEVGLTNQAEIDPRGEERGKAEDDTPVDDDPEDKSSEVSYLDWFSDSIDSSLEQPTADLEDDSPETNNDLESASGSSDAKEFDSVTEIGLSINQEEDDFSSMLGGVNKFTEDAMRGALIDPGFNQDDEPDELEDELKWLEELATNHDAPYDALPGTENDFDSLGDLSEDDYIPDWLKADVLNEASMEEPTPSSPARDEEPDRLEQPQEEQPASSQDVPDWLREQMVNETLSVQLDDAGDIDWFNQIVAGDESAIDELLAIQGMDLISEGGEPTTDETEGEPSWLLELEKLDETSDEGLFEKTSEEEIVEWASESGEEEWPTIESAGSVEQDIVASHEEIPSDPEEAMAWLDQLALEQGLAEEELADEVVDFGTDDFMEAAVEFDEGDILDAGGDLELEVPEDPDEAMAWLERLAAEHSALDDEGQIATGEAEPEMIDGLLSEKEDEELVQALSVLPGVAMPADDGEALIWLEELAVGADIAPFEPNGYGLTDDDFSFEPVETGAVPVPDEDHIEEKSPVDFEAVQATDMISEISEDPEKYIDGDLELDEISDVGLETLVTEYVVETDHDEPAKPQAAEIVEAEPEITVDQDADDLDWLDSLDEANVTGWLMAEERLLEEEKSPTDELTSARFDTVAESVFEPIGEPEVPVQPLENQQFEDHGLPRLASAQSALQEGQLVEAIDTYSVLVDSGESLPYVIADLEIAVEAYGDKPDLMKLLGDAYSRNGQLQRAIEIYRLALNNL